MEKWNKKEQQKKNEIENRQQHNRMIQLNEVVWLLLVFIYYLDHGVIPCLQFEYRQPQKGRVAVDVCAFR